jgi:hypothetical protein
VLSATDSTRRSEIAAGGSPGSDAESLFETALALPTRSNTRIANHQVDPSGSPVTVTVSDVLAAPGGRVGTSMPKLKLCSSSLNWARLRRMRAAVPVRLSSPVTVQRTLADVVVSACASRSDTAAGRMRSRMYGPGEPAAWLALRVMSPRGVGHCARAVDQVPAPASYV